MAEPDDAVTLQTILAHIQTAVRRDGVPIVTLEEMLAQLDLQHSEDGLQQPEIP